MPNVLKYFGSESVQKSKMDILAKTINGFQR